MTNLTLQTKPVKQKDIKRAWHLIDAKKKIVGRLASEVAKLLIGKHKVDYVEYLDIGDNVVVINASKIELSGKKELTKTYSRYSGYPGGLKRVSFKELKDKRPEEIVRHAVYGMLPKNKLGDALRRNVYIYAGAEHPHAAQQPKEIKLNTIK